MGGCWLWGIGAGSNVQVQGSVYRCSVQCIGAGFGV